MNKNVKSLNDLNLNSLKKSELACLVGGVITDPNATGYYTYDEFGNLVWVEDSIAEGKAKGFVVKTKRTSV